MKLPNTKALAPVLRRRLGADASDARRVEAFAALADRYGLRERLQAFLDAPEGTYEKVWTAERFWRELGASLLWEFIPAFRPPKPKRRRYPHGHEDWIEAGGTLLGGLDNYSSFYQAQLVKVIQTKKAETGKSRAWVFGWFANEKVRASPREAAARRDLLPRPYRHRLPLLDSGQDTDPARDEPGQCHGAVRPEEGRRLQGR